MRTPSKPQLASLVSAIASVSCHGASPEGQQPTPPPAPTVNVQPALSTTMSADPAASTTPTDGADPRIMKLRSHAEWRAFKALWRELDAIEPAAADAGTKLRAYGGELYAGAIERQRADGLSQRLADAVAKLEQTKLLRADETAFLRQLTNTRIRNMVEGSMPLMIMHRMPPPYAGRTYGSVDRLEQRIDLLVDLRSKGQLSGLEYARAMADVKREAVTYCVLYELGREGYALRASTIDTTDGEALLAEIERRFPDADTDAGTEASHYRQVAARAKALLPAVRALVVELER